MIIQQVAIVVVALAAMATSSGTSSINTDNMESSQRSLRRHFFKRRSTSKSSTSSKSSSKSSSSSSKSSSKSSSSSPKSSSKTFSKKGLSECFGSRAPTVFPSSAPSYSSSEPAAAVTTTHVPSYNPMLNSSEPLAAVTTTQVPSYNLTLNFTSATNATLSPSVQAISSSVSPSIVAIGLIDICPCANSSKCTSNALIEGTELRICSTAVATNGIRIVPKIDILGIETIGSQEFDNGVAHDNPQFDKLEQACEAESQSCFVSADVSDVFLLPQLPPRLVVKGSILAVDGDNRNEWEAVSMPFERVIDLQKLVNFNSLNGQADRDSDEQSRPFVIRKLALVFAIYVSVVVVGVMLWVYLSNGVLKDDEYEFKFDSDDEDYQDSLDDRDSLNLESLQLKDSSEVEDSSAVEDSPEDQVTHE